MIDIHSHLLYGVDDGSRTLEESIEIIRDLEKIGFTDIIVTPHYIQDSLYNSKKNNNNKILNTIKKELIKENIHVNLYLGNEIYINDNIEKLLENNEISPLNDSEYLLIELPMSGDYLGYEEIFLDLINQGKKIILAHPERYFAFQKDFDRIYDLEEMGVLFQCNIESIVGSYGKNAQKMMKRLLKEKKISFLGTDIHRKKDYSIWNRAHKQISKYLKEDYNIIYNNAAIILKKNN